MTYSSSDFTTDIINRLAAHNLIDTDTVMSDDLEAQAAVATEVISSLSDTVSVLAGLLEHVVSKLPLNDVQPPLPLGTCMLGSIELALRDKITTVLKADEIQRAVQGPAARFMEELLNAHDTLTGIVDQYNAQTLADVLYLHSAVHKKNFIEIEQVTDSRIVELVRQLPSADFWLQHVFILEAKQAA
jgi:hypothetical protein